MIYYWNRWPLLLLNFSMISQYKLAKTHLSTSRKQTQKEACFFTYTDETSQMELETRSVKLGSY